MSTPDPDLILDVLAGGLTVKKTAQRFELSIDEVRKILDAEIERCIDGKQLREAWALADRRLQAVELKFYAKAMEGDGDSAAAIVFLKTSERRATLAGANAPQSHILHLASQPKETQTSTERIRAAIDRIRAMPKPAEGNGAAAE